LLDNCHAPNCKILIYSFYKRNEKIIGPTYYKPALRGKGCVKSWMRMCEAGITKT